MIQFDKYVATGGQSSRPFGQFKVPYPKWKPLKRPEEVGITDLPDIDLNPEYKEKGWAICIEGDHFLPGVTAKMIDWFWCNMEKGYYLWAPGSHKRFQWMQEPWEYGFTNSKHTSLENMDENQILDLSVAAGDGYGMLLYNRYDMDVFPFDYCCKHVIIEGTKDENEHTWMLLAHMWEDVEGGCIHRMVCATETQELSRKVIRPDEYPHKKGTKNNFEHGEYELCWWPKFLPGLYNVWKDHPDPTQNVYYDLSVEKTGDYKWKYIEDNSLSVLERPQYKMNK